jgi:hypothetical protein
MIDWFAFAKRQKKPKRNRKQRDQKLKDIPNFDDYLVANPDKQVLLI